MTSQKVVWLYCSRSAPRDWLTNGEKPEAVVLILPGLAGALTTSDKIVTGYKLECCLDPNTQCIVGVLLTKVNAMSRWAQLMFYSSRAGPGPVQQCKLLLNPFKSSGKVQYVPTDSTHHRGKIQSCYLISGKTEGLTWSWLNKWQRE